MKNDLDAGVDAMLANAQWKANGAPVIKKVTEAVQAFMEPIHMDTELLTKVATPTLQFALGEVMEGLRTSQNEAEFKRHAEDALALLAPVAQKLRHRELGLEWSEVLKLTAAYENLVNICGIKCGIKSEHMSFLS